MIHEQTIKTPQENAKLGKSQFLERTSSPPYGTTKISKSDDNNKNK